MGRSGAKLPKREDADADAPKRPVLGEGGETGADFDSNAPSGGQAGADFVSSAPTFGPEATQLFYQNAEIRPLGQKNISAAYAMSIL